MSLQANPSYKATLQQIANVRHAVTQPPYSPNAPRTQSDMAYEAGALRALELFHEELLKPAPELAAPNRDPYSREAYIARRLG